jgi:hypothetical protein
MDKEASYDALVAAIGRLEAELGGNSTVSPDMVPLAARNFIQPTDGNVQYLSVDRYSHNLVLPVVVAVGANYSQGAGQLPNSSPFGLIGETGPYVEADLGKWRRPLDYIFSTYRAGHYPQDWCPSARPHPRLALCSAERPQTPRRFHFVMANFSPWITKIEWSKMRETIEARVIMESPPGTATWQEFLSRLRQTLPNNTLWVGHGNYDVHDLFMKLVVLFGLKHWLFTSNLTFAKPWLMRMLGSSSGL